MSEIFNLSSLCRCCHMDGSLRSLNFSYSYMGKVEVYANMLNETFGLLLNKPCIEASYSICKIFIEKLRNALEFKEQVQNCEMRFEKYCKNEIALQSEIKIESELYSDETIIKSDISIEDFSENSQNIESTSAEFDGEVSNSGQNYNNEERIIITNENKQNICLDKLKLDMPNVVILLEDCLKKDKILKSKILPRKSSVNRKSNISNYKIQRDDSLKKKKTVKSKILPRKSSVKPKSNIPDYKIQRDDSLKKNKTVKFKTQPKKNINKPKSEMSKSKIQQKFLQKGKSDKPGNTKTKQEKRSIFCCKFCNKDFSTMGELKQHKLQHSAKGNDCDFCGKKFRCRTTLVYHINTHTREKVFTCDICNTEFLYKLTLKKHILYNHLGETKHFMCEFCGQQFFDGTNMNIHISTVHMKLRPFKCDQCPKTYTTNKNLKTHLRTHTGERPYKCQHCDKAFVSSNYLSSHKKKEHKSLYQACHECNICGKQFIDKYNCTVHTRTHIGEKPFKCKVCEKHFTSEFNLKRHINVHHRSDICVKTYQCHICKKYFTSKFTRRRHIETLHDVNWKKIPCELCHSSFVKKAQLTRHMKIVHNPDPQFIKKKCSLCSCIVRDMEKHLKNHMDSSRTFKCSHCPKSYPTQKSLNRHSKETHSGITYDCELCAKKFVAISNLKRHKMGKHNIQVQLKVEQANVREIKSENNV